MGFATSLGLGIEGLGLTVYPGFGGAVGTGVAVGSAVGCGVAVGFGVAVAVGFGVGVAVLPPVNPPDELPLVLLLELAGVGVALADVDASGLVLGDTVSVDVTVAIEVATADSVGVDDSIGVGVAVAVDVTDGLTVAVAASGVHPAMSIKDTINIIVVIGAITFFIFQFSYSVSLY